MPKRQEGDFGPNSGGESGGCTIMHIGNEIEDLLWRAIRRSEHDHLKLFPMAISEFHCIFETRSQYLKSEVQWMLEWKGAVMKRCSLLENEWWETCNHRYSTAKQRLEVETSEQEVLNAKALTVRLASWFAVCWVCLAFLLSQVLSLVLCLGNYEVLSLSDWDHSLVIGEEALSSKAEK